MKSLIGVPSHNTGITKAFIESGFRKPQISGKLIKSFVLKCYLFTFSVLEKDKHKMEIIVTHT